MPVGRRLQIGLIVLAAGSALATLAWIPKSRAAAPESERVRPAGGQVTFTKDIAPILFNNCTSCHRPGEAAPFALQNYADARSRASVLAAVTKQRLMPPWKAGKGDCDFQGDRRLTETQIAALQQWAADGAPEGDRAAMPPMPSFPPGWTLGKPDLVVKMPTAFRVPAEGPDIYRNFVLPLNLSEDRWVRAVDFRPGARSVVHHSLFFLDATGSARKLEGKDSQPGFGGGMGAIFRAPGAREGLVSNLFGGGGKTSAGIGAMGGWALGARPRTLPDGLAYHVPKGSDLILSTHFHPSGKVEEESSTVGLYFADRPPTRQFAGVQLPPLFGALAGIDIPAGAADYTVEDSFVLPVDIQGFGIGAHAHYLGKEMKMTATLPDGQSRTLLWIPDWDFSWQEQYLFKNYVPLPKGTRLNVVMRYDNSAKNPRNPRNPPGRVTWGEQSNDEMGSVFLQLVAAKDEELPTLQQAYRQHIRECFTKGGARSLRHIR